MATGQLTVAAAIIGGGQATRFGGRNKSEVIVHGRTIIDRQASVLQPLSRTLFIVAPQADRYASLPWRVVADTVPGGGVLGAILTALESADADLVLTVAADLPFLDRGVLARLITLASETAADGAWIETPAGPEPLIACYRTAAASRIRAWIAEGHMAARSLQGPLAIRTMGVDELARFGDPATLLANINSPEDLSTIEGS